MTLPIDITTSLWFKYEPVWAWEPVPDAPTPPAVEGAVAPAVDGTNTAPPSGPDDVEAAPGYRRVLQSLRLVGSVQWLPCDSPLSRPWLRADFDLGEASRRRSERHRDAVTEDPTPADDVRPPESGN